MSSKIRSIFYLFSFFLCFVSAASGRNSDFSTKFARECREVFSVDNVPADSPGGWSFISSMNDGDTLCLVGTLESVDLLEIANRVLSQPIKQILVRSAGGPSHKWLAVAELLQSENATLIVDDLCLSACAIYLTPVAKDVLTLNGSIVAWHGGAGPDTLANPDLMIDSVATALGLANLEERTIRLYESKGISPDILTDSLIKTDPRLLSRLVEKLPQPVPSIISVIGYAYSPQTLRECFGFMNVGNMWHPGEDFEVAKIVNARNRNLIALESPKNRLGTPFCKK